MRARRALTCGLARSAGGAHPPGRGGAHAGGARPNPGGQWGGAARPRRYATRPYEIVVLSDHGQTQGATFRQRNGHALAGLVDEALETGGATAVASGDENAAMVGNALKEATGARADGKQTAPRSEAAGLASGNLGLIYLMDSDRRLTLEEIEARHPRLLTALRTHPHIGFALAPSSESVIVSHCA